MKNYRRAGAAAAAAALMTFSGHTVWEASLFHSAGRIEQTAADFEAVGEDMPETEEETLEMPPELAGEALETGYRAEPDTDQAHYAATVLEDGTVSISMDGFYSMKAGQTLKVPGEIDGRTVTAIADEGFCRGNSFIGKVILPDSITVIGDGAFAACTNLKEISFGENITRIGAEAFAGCSSLESVHLPDTLSQIGDRAFAGCGASTLTGGSNESWQVEDGVLYGEGKTLLWYPAGRSGKVFRVKDGTKKIAEGAFGGCEKLQKLILPASLSSVGKGSFAGSGIREFSLAEESSEFKVADGVLFSGKGKVLSAYPPKAERTWYSVPEGTTMIADGAFAGCSLWRVILPSGLTLVGEEAFRNCTELRGIRVPDCVLRVGARAFEGCTKLEKAVWEARTDMVEEGMFRGCVSLGTVSLPVGVFSIDREAFAGCSSLMDIHLPASLQRIGEMAFDGCTALKKLMLPKDLAHIDRSALPSPSGSSLVLRVAKGSASQAWAKRRGYRVVSLSPALYEHYQWGDAPSGWEKLDEAAKEAQYKNPEIIKQVQIILNGAGLDCGKTDGVMGRKTREAIRKFREDRSMEEGEEIDEKLLRSMGIEPVTESGE